MRWQVRLEGKHGYIAEATLADSASGSVFQVFSSPACAKTLLSSLLAALMRNIPGLSFELAFAGNAKGLAVRFRIFAVHSTWPLRGISSCRDRVSRISASRMLQSPLLWSLVKTVSFWAFPIRTALHVSCCARGEERRRGERRA